MGGGMERSGCDKRVKLWGVVFSEILDADG